MIYAVIFGCAVTAGWVLAVKLGGAAERETMCLLTCMWVATIVANMASGEPAPYGWYSLIDTGGITWLFAHQRRNWQWIPAGIFAVMLLTHFVFWTATQAGDIAYRGRPYQDILAVLGYLQILSVGFASYERQRARAGRLSWLGHRLMASDLLPRWRQNHTHHAWTP